VTPGCARWARVDDPLRYSGGYGQCDFGIVSSHPAPTQAESTKPGNFTKTADEILDKIRRFGLRTKQVSSIGLLIEITDPWD
jgi:hypothetical protein